MNWKTMTCLGVVMLLCSSYARAGDEPVKPALTTVSASPAETVAYGDEAGPRDGQCLSGGCSNFTSNYPSGTFSTTSSFFTTVSTCIYGGEFAYYSVVAGETYEWSLCSADGGSCAFDSQLTLTSADGATAYCYSDDHCGDDAKIMWTASFTGTVRVLLSKYNCADQNTCTTLVWRCASCGVTCVPDYAVTAPYTSPLRNTCTPAVSDCTLRPSPEHIYEVTIPSSGDWKFSLCPGPGTFDTYMYLGTSCCGGTIASNDDACAPESEITALGLSAGIYYVTIEGYYSSSPSWCGDYILEITQLVPCAVNCEPGDVSESEPGCGVGYVDAWNGGCNSTPDVFQAIDCGQTICGTSGTWTEGTINYRDTDWYSVTTTQPTIFTWSAVAEFPVLIFVIDGTCGCGGYTVVSSATAAECVTASITTACLPPGTYWFWVGPSAFTGVACGAEYRATLSCTPCTPPTSLPGETCAVAIPIPALPFTDSGTTVGYANNYDYACPYTGSTSPDVVYAYTPAVNEALKINLCDSEYDTKVYVYEDLCCNPPIACNDDDTTVCTLAYRSYLTCVPVQAGHTYYIVVDGYGGAAGNYVLTVSRNDLLITCPADISVGTDDGLCTASVALEAVASGDCGPITVTYAIGGMPITSPHAFSPGTVTVTATATDAVGQTAVCTFDVSVTDDEAPIITTCPPSRTLPGDIACQALVPDLTGEVVATDNCGIAGITQAPAAGTTIGSGVTTVTMTVTDTAGLTATCEVVLTVGTPKMILEAVDCQDDAYPATPGYQVKVELWMRDLCHEVTGFQAFLDYDPAVLSYNGGLSFYNNAVFPSHIQNIATAEVNPTLGYLNLDGSVPPNGAGTTNDALLATLVFDVDGECTPTLVTYRSYGPFVSELSYQGYLVPTTLVDVTFSADDTPPTIAGCPADISQDTDAGLCSAVVTWTEPTASDNCPAGATILQTAGLPPGSAFPVGVTTVTYTATDVCGNTAVCTFTVTVTDHENPTISCPADVSVDADVGFCYATGVDLGTPTAGDNCGVAGVTNDAPAQFPVGVTVVTWMVTDLYGNTASCTQNVTVTDNENPTIVCPPDVTATADPGVCHATGVALGTPTTGDNCGVAGVTNDAPAQFPVGVTVVTWTVTDLYGNTATCTQTVTVTDDEDPTIICPPDRTVYADAGGCTAVVDLGTPTTNDNCGVAGVTNDAPVQFPVGVTVVTWTVTDLYGNTATCAQNVTVLGQNQVAVVVELVGVNISGVQRCIRFVADDCSAVADHVLTFIDHDGDDANADGWMDANPTMPSTPVRTVDAVIDLPCGSWTFLCAKDQQHTLYDSETLVVAGPMFALGGDGVLSLIGGDTDNDSDVDIHDVTFFMAAYGTPAPPLACPWNGVRNADFSNNGLTSSEDWTFLTTNWLTWYFCACTGYSSGGPPIAKLAVSMSSAELAAVDARRLDANADGVIDYRDVRAFERRNGFDHTLSNLMQQMTQMKPQDVIPETTNLPR